MSSAETQKLAKKLLSKKPDVAAMHDRSSVVDAVFNDEVISARSKSKQEFFPTKSFSESHGSNGVVSDPKMLVYGGEGMDAVTVPGDCPYIPRGACEGMEAYTKRLSMTPWFPETPKILGDRKGQLFRISPKVVGSKAGDADVVDFIAKATPDGNSFLWVIDQMHDEIERHGFGGVYIDRDPPTPEMLAKREAGEPISMAEMRNLKLRITPIRGTQILDYQFYERGLLWVKFVDFYILKNSWDADPVPVAKVTIVDQLYTQTYEIVGQGKDIEIVGPEIYMHGHTFDDYPAVPFVFFNSPSGEYPLGNPLLLASARGDVAATRQLSEAIWTLFVCGVPLLNIKTQDVDGWLRRKIASTAGSIVVLEKGADYEESLEYISLDPTGIKFQMEMVSELVKRGKELGGVGGDAALSVPTEQSGVSRAWQFKTGEQRLLFLLVNELSNRTNELMDHLAWEFGFDPDTLGVEFDDSFDGLGDKDDIQVTSDSLSIFDKYSETASKTMVKKMAHRLMPDLDQETLDTIETEIDAYEKQKIVPPPQEPEKDEEETDENKMK